MATTNTHFSRTVLTFAYSLQLNGQYIHLTHATVTLLLLMSLAFIKLASHIPSTNVHEKVQLIVIQNRGSPQNNQ